MGAILAPKLLLYELRYERVTQRHRINLFSRTRTMCLAVPAKLIEQDGGQGIADLHGNRVQVTTLLVPEARVGDWVLMHAGFAIQRLTEGEAEETWSVLRQVERVEEGGNT